MQLTRRLIAPLALALGMTSLHADPTAPTVDRQDGLIHQTAGLSGFNVTGSLMAGISVTAYFGQAFESLIWQDLGGNSGGVSGDGWSLTLDGDSIEAPWILTNESSLAITRLVINGQPGGILFDTLEVADPDPQNSPGSATGNAMKDSEGSDPDLLVDAVYRNLVKVGGVAYGDLYTSLDIAFSSEGNADGMFGDFRFLSDTDAICATGCTLEPEQPTRVPEPAGLALLGLALLGATRVTRRTR